MDQHMIEVWNAVVKKGDDVYHIGDLTFGDPEQYVKRLNGKIHLVPGNHDRVKKYARLIEHGKVKLLPELHRCSLNGQYMTLCHYALATWDRAHYGSWMLHGHSHGTYKGNGKIMDMGVDCLPNYAPISFENLKIEMEKRVFTPVDHHEER
jgi:calcineurin-like phosphoesterase family protein